MNQNGASNALTPVERFVTQTSANILQLSPDDICLTDSFLELGGTSIDLYDLIMELEDRFDIEIDQGVSQHLSSLEDWADYIAEKIGGSHA